MVLLPTFALGETVPVSFHWSPPTEGAAVDYYIVYAAHDDEEFRFEAVRTDTVYVLEAELGVEYRIRVSGVSFAGHQGEMSVPSDIAYLPEELPEEGGPPPSSDLRSNFPNPFNPETTIRYGIPESLSSGARVSLELYNVRGERVRVFPVNRSPGWHETTWNGRDETGDMQPSGHYIVRLVADGKVSTWKMTMIK